MEKDTSNGNGTTKIAPPVTPPSTRKALAKLMDPDEDLIEAEEVGEITATAAGMAAQTGQERYRYSVEDRKAFATKNASKIAQAVLRQQFEDAGILRPAGKK